MKLATKRQKIAHLLRRFALGASEAELTYYGKNGLKGAIDLLLNFDSTAWQWDVRPQLFANKQGTVNIRVMQALWYTRMLVTQRPLEEKLTLFWHSHFATSAQKVERSYVMEQHIQVLRANCIGKFEDLLVAVSKNPAMLYWLDNQENVKGQPNENFAREIMELFTLGIGHYTEKDVQEAARAFTGWGYGVGRRLNTDSPRGPERFVFSPDRHDDGVKSVLGVTATLSGEDVIGILCGRPETSRFLVKKLWEFFVYPEPSEEVVEKFAKIFRNSGLDMKVLLRAIMDSTEFYSDKAAGAQVKHPIDFVIPTLRQLGVGSMVMERIERATANPEIGPENGLNIGLTRALAPAFAALTTSKSMGMELMYPPDVSGWATGFNWITTATMLERVKWAERVFFGSVAPGGAPAAIAGGAGNRAPQVGYQPIGLFEADPTPAGIVRVLLSVFDAKVADSKLKVMEEAAEKALKGRLTPVSAGDAARAVCKLLFGSPEFQFA